MNNDKNFNVFGRTYSKGILLTAQADESMYAADKAARISFNVENVSKLKFSFARAITDDCGVDTTIRILNDYGQNMTTKLTSKQGEKTSGIGLPVQGSDFITECELDVSNTDVITFVYNNQLKDTYAIIGGNQYGYLIYGTIKFEQPVTALEDESGYYCIFKAEIEAVNMKNGNIVYSSVTTYESKGKNWNECVSKGKDKLAELVVSDIIYGL